MNNSFYVASGIASLLLLLPVAARAQNQNQGNPQGVHALVFHMNDTGVVVTEQLRVPSRFALEIDGILVSGVHKIDGIEHQNEVVEYQDGDDMQTHYRPGRFKPGRLIIEKDWSSTLEFAKWIKASLDGKVERKSMSIVFPNDAGEEKRINLYDCYPTKWVGPALNARTSAHASERIEIVFERLEMK
jgi:phage tail-like protein